MQYMVNEFNDDVVLGLLNEFNADDDETAIRMFADMSCDCDTILYNYDTDESVAIRRDGMVYDF